MEAKDTVSRVKCHCELYYQECSCSCDDCTHIKLTNRASEEQAKISFPAGIGEVVKWIKSRLSNREPISSVYDDPGFIFTYGYKFSISETEWQAQLKIWFKDNPEMLKEWGMDNG